MKKNRYKKMEPQVNLLCEKLDRELDNFPIGSRFYSLRELQEKYKFHRGIIDRALECLEQRELIRRVSRVGLFSNVTRKPKAHKVMFLHPDWPSSLIRGWAVAAPRYVAQQEEWQWQTRSIDPTLPLALTCAPELKGMDAAILFCPSRNILREDTVWLASLAIPLVLLNADTGSFELSCVLADEQNGAALACSYLCDKGHRRVVIVYSEPHTEISEIRINSLLIAMKQLNMESILLDCDTVNAEYSPHSAYTRMKRYLKENDGRADFTAVFSHSGDCVPGIMTALREYGYKLPDDISMISMTDEETGRFNHPPLTAVCNRVEDEVEMAFEGLKELLNKARTSFKAIAPMRLIERASVRDISTISE